MAFAQNGKVTNDEQPFYFREGKNHFPLDSIPSGIHPPLHRRSSMFIGHFAVGFATRKYATRPSLGTLFLAAQFVDLLWPLFLILNIEQVKIDPGNTVVTPLAFIHYPFTHSLAAVLGWAVLFGVVYFIIRRDWKSSLWLGILVLSHWILDFITHRADLPLIPGHEKLVGLGLWNSLTGTILFEGILFLTGILLYLGATRAKNRIGTFALWSLVIFLVAIHLGNLFGPPPPSAKMIGWVGFSQWLLVLWGYWIDRNRFARKAV